MNFSFPVRIYIIALVFRLIPVLLTRSLGIGLDDMFQYDMLARSLAAGNGFRWYAQEDLKQLEPYVDFDLATANGYDPQYGLYTSFRAPLYPAFLAIVYFFSGTGFSRFLAARLAQVILLGAPLAPLTYLVSKHLSSFLFPQETNDERRRKIEHIAKVSAWLVACYPMLLVYPLGLGTENPFFVLLLLSFLFLLKSIERPAKLNFILSGVFLALTVLTRSVILPFAGLAIVFVIARSRQAAGQSLIQKEVALGKTASRNDIWIVAAFVLVLAPWVVRNSLLHHKLTGIETSIGYNLYLGYYPQGNGSFIFGPSLDLLTIMDDAERDEIGVQKAIGFIKAQPERILPLAINRLGFFFGLEKRVLMYFYSNNLIGYLAKPLLLFIAAILLLPFVIISTSAMFGLSYLQWNPQTILLALMLFAYLLPHIFILAEDRFHLALIPYFAILAVQFWMGRIQELSNRWNGSLTGKLIVSLAVCAALLLFLNWGFELSRDADKIAQLLGPNGNNSHFPY
ncbi:MAG: glycosyltransferase family 39 protein [Chloroflexi bacterium]|nr:glycosyltransferase family 39 protein [Chloroflexota bacterium]